jgi:sigma-B regulation protein RsbU (phosphoserine phosphatase)
MEPGDLMVLYTDGITEAVDESGDEYGRERLVHTIRTSRHLDPIAIVNRVFHDVEKYEAASPPADDQTMVVVKRSTPEPEEIPA